MRGTIEEFVDGQVIVLPCLSPELPHGWPPSDRAREAWTASFVRRLEREGDADGLPEAVQWEWREEHPSVRRFLSEVVEAATERYSGSSQRLMPQPDHPLTQREAEELVRRIGSLRKAADNSQWTYSHIARVRKGERGKPSI